MGGHAHDRVEGAGQLGHPHEAHHILYTVSTCLVHGRPRADVRLNERLVQGVEGHLAQVEGALGSSFEGGDGDGRGHGVGLATQGAQHLTGMGLVGRLLQHASMEHDHGVSGDENIARSQDVHVGVGLFAGHELSHLHTLHLRRPCFVHVARHALDMEAQHAHQFPSARALAGQHDSASFEVGVEGGHECGISVHK